MASTGVLEEGQVRAMFDRIAGVYDLLNSVMTVGLHHRWRSRAADLAAVGPGSRVLDVATGTGDLAIELSRRGCEVVGSDFSEQMLDRARHKAPGLGLSQADPRPAAPQGARAALGARQRAGAALPRRHVRRRHGRLRRAQ